MTAYQYNAHSTYVAMNDWVNSATTATAPMTVTLQTQDITTAKPQSKPKRRTLRDRVDDFWHRREEARQKHIAANIMPRIAGASPEAEVEKTVEQKKKIVLTRKVGVERDKGGSSLTPTHKGTVTLVRDMAGAPHQRSSIGIRSEPDSSNSYVEIPIAMLREALDDLDSEDK
jgi:hypothetical protein